MGKSLFGKLKSVLSRKKTSEISAAAPQPQATANLSRIGLGNSAPYTPDSAMNAPDISGFPPPCPLALLQWGPPPKPPAPASSR